MSDTSVTDTNGGQPFYYIGIDMIVDQRSDSILTDDQLES